MVQAITRQFRDSSIGVSELNRFLADWQEETGHRIVSVTSSPDQRNPTVLNYVFFFEEGPGLGGERLC